jgi:hypothetical protein
VTTLEKNPAATEAPAASALAARAGFAGLAGLAGGAPAEQLIARPWPLIAVMAGPKLRSDIPRPVLGDVDAYRAFLQCLWSSTSPLSRVLPQALRLFGLRFDCFLLDCDALSQQSTLDRLRNSSLSSPHDTNCEPVY